jgi:hypothetical protein
MPELTYPAAKTAEGVNGPGFPPELLEGASKPEPTSVGSTYNPSREVFIFTYKRGHAVISAHFQSDSLKDAVREAKEVCRVRRWTFIGVTPFLRDIKKMMEEEF